MNKSPKGKALKKVGEKSQTLYGEKVHYGGKKLKEDGYGLARAGKHIR